jgi:minor histocompatibility antigen H13
MKTILVKDIKIPLAVLLVINLLNFVHPLPVVVQMIASAVILAFVGCILSASIQSATYEEIQNCENKLKNRQEEGGFLKRCWQIGVYPLTATVLLLLLYFFVKEFEQITKEFVLNTIFMVLSTFYCIKASFNYVSKHIKDYLEATNISEELATAIKFILINIIFPVVCFLPALLEIMTKHWLIDNLYGIAFSLLAIKSANIRSFKIALPVLWLLFFYDLFWVYETDVMVTVAKSIDLPLKLQFPYFDKQDSLMKFSMLGLGDIVLPGLLLSLCIKYDIDACILSNRKPKKLEEFTLPLFYSTLFAYGLSLLTTFLAMKYFEHPQPALVFIVPLCSLALLVYTRFSQHSNVWKYDSGILTRRNSSQRRQEMDNII